MSMQTPITVKCPKCGAEVQSTQWVSVNAAQDPQLKQQMLDASLFRLSCPSCGHEGLLAYPMVYVDPDKKLIIGLVMNEEQIDQCAQSLESLTVDGAPVDVSSYTRRVVLDQNDLREKIMIFDCQLDDRVVQIAKIVVFTQIQMTQPGKEVYQIYFICPQEGEQALQVIFSDGSSVNYMLAKELYDSIAQDFAQRIEEKSQGTYVFDAQWGFDAVQEDPMEE